MWHFLCGIFPPRRMCWKAGSSVAVLVVFGGVTLAGDWVRRVGGFVDE